MSIDRCANCNVYVIDDTKEDNWRRLVNFFELAYTEDMVTMATRDAMIGALMDFKTFAHEDCDKS